MTHGFLKGGFGHSRRKKVFPISTFAEGAQSENAVS